MVRVKGDMVKAWSTAMAVVIAEEGTMGWRGIQETKLICKPPVALQFEQRDSGR